MTFAKLYSVVRSILGDEEVHGLWYYADARLDSAIRSIFLLGRSPGGYGLSEDQNSIVPDLKTGDDFALVSYETSLLLIGGEDGAVKMHTRAMSLADEGHRKRDLLVELKQQIYQIRDGTAVFATYQNFESFIRSLRPDIPFPLQFSEATVVTKGPDLVL